MTRQAVAFSIAILWSLAGTAAPLAGSYEYVGGEVEVKALYASVESVVKKMSIVVRGIARKRLRKPNMPAARLELIIGPTQITIVRTGRDKLVAPSDGSPVKWRNPEGTFMVKHVLDGGALLETVDGKSSHSTNRFALDKDGVTLTVRTRIVSSRLPGPVEFALTYRRK